jgi:hypothetical protein
MWQRVRMLFRGLTRRSQIESGMSDEMSFHIEARVRGLIETEGIAPDEARRQARLEFGSPERYVHAMSRRS